MYYDNKVYFKLFLKTNDRTVDFEQKIVSLFLSFSFFYLNKLNKAKLVQCHSDPTPGWYWYSSYSACRTPMILIIIVFIFLYFHVCSYRPFCTQTSKSGLHPTMQIMF